MSRALLQQAWVALTQAANNQGNVADYKNVADALEQELAKQEFYPDWDTLQPFYERIAELEKELAKPAQEHMFDTPEAHIVHWSIPVDPNNFGEPLAQPEQEPQFAQVGEIRSSVWAGHNWAHHFNAEAKLDLKTKLYIKLEHEHE
jgi:hypothetical protein